VREVALAHGLVDYKVCAIDETWSALKFSIRAEDKIKTVRATEKKKPVRAAAKKKAAARR